MKHSRLPFTRHSPQSLASRPAASRKLRHLLHGGVLATAIPAALVAQETITYVDGETAMNGIITSATAGPTTLFIESGFATQVSNISGNGQIIKSGDGTLRLEGLNSYEGGTVLQAGRLELLDDDARSSGPFTLENDAELRSINGYYSTNEIRIRPGHTGRISHAGTRSVAVYGGDYELLGDLRIGAPDATGLVQFELGSGSYSRTPKLWVDYGTFRNASVGGPNWHLTVAENATYSVRNFFEIISNLSGTGTVTNDNLTSTGLLIGGGDWRGVIEDGIGGITVDIGNSTMVMGSQNTYSLGTYVTGGILRLEHNQGAGTGGIYLRDSMPRSTVDYPDGAAIENPIFPEFSTFRNSSTHRLQVLSGTATQLGDIIENGGPAIIEKTGDGTLILANPNINVITGGFILSGGTLSFGVNSGALAAIGSTTEGTITFNGGNLRYTRSGTNYVSSRQIVVNANGGGIDVATTAATAFLLDGVVSGTGTLTKTGTGQLALRGDHSAFTGAVSVQGGEFLFTSAHPSWAANAFSVGGGAALRLQSPTSADRTYTLGSLAGAGDIVIEAANGAVTTLAVGADGADTTFDGDISSEGEGVAALTKQGGGTLILNGDHAFLGATEVEAGKLVVNGAFASSSVTIRGGAGFGGSGTFAGQVSFAAGATLAPGNSPGTVTFAQGLALDGGSILEFELGTVSDLIVVSGGVLAGPAEGQVTLHVADAGGFQTGTYTLFDFGTGATLNDFDLDDFVFGDVVEGYNYSLSFFENTLRLTAIPEPSAYATLAGLFAAGLVAWRRPRKSSGNRASR